MNFKFSKKELLPKNGEGSKILKKEKKRKKLVNNIILNLLGRIIKDYLLLRPKHLLLHHLLH